MLKTYVFSYKCFNHARENFRYAVFHMPIKIATTTNSNVSASTWNLIHLTFCIVSQCQVTSVSWKPPWSCTGICSFFKTKHNNKKSHKDSVTLAKSQATLQAVSKLTVSQPSSLPPLKFWKKVLQTHPYSDMNLPCTKPKLYPWMLQRTFHLFPTTSTCWLRKFSHVSLTGSPTT